MALALTTSPPTSHITRLYHYQTQCTPPNRVPSAQKQPPHISLAKTKPHRLCCGFGTNSAPSCTSPDHKPAPYQTWCTLKEIHSQAASLTRHIPFNPGRACQILVASTVQIILDNQGRHLSYIMQLTEATKYLYKNCFHGQKCKIWIFERPPPFKIVHEDQSF